MREGALRVIGGELVAEFIVGRCCVKRDVVFGQRGDDAVAGEHGGSFDDRRRADAVDADFRAEADGQFADKMAEGGFADVVGFAAALGDHGVGGAGEHDGTFEILGAKDVCGFGGEQVIRRDVEVERGSPCRIADGAGGRRGEDGGGVDENVESAKGRDGRAHRGMDLIAVADIDGERRYRFFSGDGAQRLRDGFGAGEVAIGEDEVGSALGGQLRGGAADAAGGADDEGNLAAQFFFRGLAANLRVFQRASTRCGRLPTRGSAT